MSLAKGSFCKSKNQGISISWMVFKYLHMCECMRMYVCMLRKCTLAPKTGHEFYGGRSYKALYNSHFPGLPGSLLSRHSVLMLY